MREVCGLEIRLPRPGRARDHASARRGPLGGYLAPDQARLDVLFVRDAAGVGEFPLAMAAAMKQIPRIRVMTKGSVTQARIGPKTFTNPLILLKV